jgi:hypothetical protein
LGGGLTTHSCEKKIAVTKTQGMSLGGKGTTLAMSKDRNLECVITVERLGIRNWRNKAKDWVDGGL